MEITYLIPVLNEIKTVKESIIQAIKVPIKNKEIIIVYDDENKSEISYLKSIIKKRKNTILIINKKSFS